MTNKYLFALSCLAATFAPSVHSDDSEKLDLLLQAVQELKREQSALREQMQCLSAALSGSAGQCDVAQAPIAIGTAPKKGFVAFVHELDDGKPGALLDRIIVNGFPMSHDIAREYKVDNKEVAYRGQGLLEVDEDGIYSFQIDTDTNIIGSCYFSFTLNEVPVFRQVRIRHTDGRKASEIELRKGRYEFATTQSCDRTTDVMWEFYMLKPSGSRPVPLTSSYLSYLPQ